MLKLKYYAKMAAESFCDDRPTALPMRIFIAVPYLAHGHYCKA